MKLNNYKEAFLLMNVYMKTWNPCLCIPDIANHLLVASLTLNKPAHSDNKWSKEVFITGKEF